ncbi:MAG: MarR family winged helix-turn-helix transcriptional regulator [Nannocystaceae bacterium]|nr:MarR family transcriptional regulator [bacterium]
MSAVEDAADEIESRCLGTRIRVLDRTLSTLFDRHLRPLGIRITQLTLLTAISQMGETGPRELVQRLRLEKSTVSRTIDRLIDLGWITTTAADDGRSYRIKLTRKGRNKLVEAHPAWQRAQAEAERMLGASHVSAIRKVGDAVGGKTRGQKR